MSRRVVIGAVLVVAVMGTGFWLFTELMDRRMDSEPLAIALEQVPVPPDFAFVDAFANDGDWLFERRLAFATRVYTAIGTADSVCQRVVAFFESRNIESELRSVSTEAGNVCAGSIDSDAADVAFSVQGSGYDAARERGPASESVQVVFQAHR